MSNPQRPGGTGLTEHTQFLDPAVDRPPYQPSLPPWGQPAAAWGDDLRTFLADPVRAAAAAASVALLVGVAVTTFLFVSVFEGGGERLDTDVAATAQEVAPLTGTGGTGDDGGAAAGTDATAGAEPSTSSTAAEPTTTITDATSTSTTVTVPTTAPAIPTTAAAAPTTPTTTPTLVTEAPTTVATQPPPTEPPSTQPAPTQAAPTQPPETRPPETRPPETQPPATNPPGNQGVEQQILDLVNNERSASGCGALSLNGTLNAVADAHSEDMAANDYFDHTNQHGQSPFDRISAAGYQYGTAGENIAVGYRDAAAVMEGWMNSPGHRRNILNCSFTQLGVGFAQASGGRGSIYWTQVFATPR